MWYNSVIKRNKKSKRVASYIIVFVLALIFFISAQMPAMATRGYEHKYVDGSYSIYVEYPLDIWYKDLNEGVEIFPIVVDTLAYPYEETIVVPNRGRYVYRYVPSHIQIEIYARDASNLSDVPTWMDIKDNDINFLVKHEGTRIVFSYKAGVAGSFGDGEKYKIGVSYAVEWTFVSTPVLNHYVTHSHWTTISKYYHLGKIDVYLDAVPEDNNERLRAFIPIAIPNSDARQRAGDRFEFFVRVKILYTQYIRVLWWWMKSQNDATSKTIEFPFIGNNCPSTDAALYLLLAQEVSWRTDTR